MPDTKKITIPKSVKWIEPTALKNTSLKTVKAVSYTHLLQFFLGEKNRKYFHTDKITWCLNWNPWRDWYFAVLWIWFIVNGLCERVSRWEKMCIRDRSCVDAHAKETFPKSELRMPRIRKYTTIFNLRIKNILSRYWFNEKSKKVFFACDRFRRLIGTSSPLLRTKWSFSNSLTCCKFTITPLEQRKNRESLRSGATVFWKLMAEDCFSTFFSKWTSVWRITDDK